MSTKPPGFGTANPWWAVYWAEPQGGRGAVPLNGNAVVQAASKAAAITAANVPAHANVTSVNGPFPTQAAAQANVAGTLPTGSTPQSGNLIGSLNPLGSVGDFFSRLSQASTWIRIGEALLGLALIIVGLAKLTGAGKIAVTAGKTAAKLGLAA